MAATVVTERTFPVPVEKLWQAITTKEAMDQWYFPIASFNATPGFQFSFSGVGSDGDAYIHHCEVQEVIPNRKLSYTWRYAGMTGESLLTFELFPEGDHTRLVLTHSGLDAFAAYGNDFSSESFTGGWNHFVNKALPGYLEK